MIRKLVHSVIETALQTPTQPVIYPHPFTRQETVHLGWLTNAAPCFPVKSSDISILDEPQEFYNTLIGLCKTAKSRITLASLYLGNSDLERTIVQSILDNSNFNRLKINVLLDYARGSRLKVNSRVMLQPILERDCHNCTVSLYHTPALRSLIKRIAPNRWNELFGIQHMKLYIFDDTLLISGANLSTDYFTNRQDRYFMIRDRALSDFYCGLVQRVQGFSLTVGKEDKVRLPETLDKMPYEGNKWEFIEKAADAVEGWLDEAKERCNGRVKEGYDTWVFPLVQMGQLGIQHDSNITDRIFADAPKGAHINIATAYFNLTQDYIRTLIFDSAATCNVLMAHPTANGFLGAKGMAGGIPDGYSLIARRFKAKLEKYKQTDRIVLNEYIREGWTYHVKGLWYYAPESKHPCLTLIGSPNFGDRSVDKDLESQVAIVTENPQLQERLHDECTRLYKRGNTAQLDRDIPAWVYAMVFLFRGFF